MTATDPVLYWLEDGKFARAMRVGSGPNNSSILVVDLTTGDGPTVVGKPDWFAAGYVAAYGGLVPECADEGTEPGQWSYGVAKLPATPPADPERETDVSDLLTELELVVSSYAAARGPANERSDQRYEERVKPVLHKIAQALRSAPPAPAASSELLAAAERLLADMLASLSTSIDLCNTPSGDYWHGHADAEREWTQSLRSAIAAEKARREEKPCP